MPPIGLPRDPAQWLSIALAVLALALAPRLLQGARHRLFVALAALSATALSAAYVVVYLRGGPRIIDAGAYWLEARGLSEGLLSFPLREPETSVLGRFLVRSEHPDGPHAAVIFPPGWPAVLAAGFLARAPLAVGPLIAAAIVIATFDLAAHLAKRLGIPDAPSIPRLAALLSVSCAALRYHTADTMSHGLSALCFTAALALAFRAIDALGERRARRALVLAALAGLAAGWLFATRPVSAVALGIALASLLPAPRLALPFALGALPGALLFFAHQHAATGAWGASSQRLYYELGDGPPGCFRYGFGAGIGCIGEHGDFVRARLADGFGFIAAAGTTLRRLKMHLVDPLNLEPLALLVPAGAVMTRREPRARAVGIAVLAQIAVYVPFYFDGNYPAGGGRFFCDVLPLEHALAAIAIVTLASRTKRAQPAIAAALAVSLLGFALRAGFDHAQLRDRDGGRPLFEPETLARAGVGHGLVFVDTDHGFDLAYDPALPGGLAFARLHGDGVDRLAWEARGRPAAYRHRFTPSPNGPGTASIEPMTFDPSSPLVLEAESLWPPVAQEGGFALIAWASGSCASGSRWLALHPAPGGAPTGNAPTSTAPSGGAPAPSITLELPARALSGRLISPRVAGARGAEGEVILTADGAEVHRWAFAAPGDPGPTCRDLPPARVPLGVKRLRLALRGVRDTGVAPPALDSVTAREND